VNKGPHGKVRWIRIAIITVQRRRNFSGGVCRRSALPLL